MTIASRFNAFRIHNDATGHRSGVEQISLDDLSPGEVVINTAYSSVNFKDALAGTGEGKILRRFPLVGGIDVAGHVVAEAITELKSRGMQIVATHLSEQSVDFREVDYTLPSCVLLGAERWGLTPEAAELADHNVIVPMMGMVSSLNVSVAAAVILFEAQRQRAKAGMYNSPRLEPEVLSRLEYEWLYPREAEHFRTRGEPYPDLGPLEADTSIRIGLE